jgi:hypothetical protein
MYTEELMTSQHCVTKSAIYEFLNKDAEFDNDAENE